MGPIKIAFLCCLLCVACSQKKPAEQPPVPVTAIRVSPQTLPANFQYVGVGKSSHIVQMRARVEGYLESIDYVEGALVHTGELMFILDQRPFVAVLEEAQGELLRQQAILWNAEQTKNRMVPLYKENAVSQKDMDDALASEWAAQAAVAIAKANVEKAEVNLSYTTIQAPVTGMASNAKFREGALISPGPDNLLTEIYVIDPIWVYFSVSSGDILKARGEAAQGLVQLPPDNRFDIEVEFADGSVLPAEGKIDFTSPSLQQSTGTMLVRTVLPNPKGYLKPGEFVSVIVKGAVRPNAIAVPQQAVMQGMNGTFVWVINEKSEAQMRPVVAGDWYKDDWIINSGLKPGDIVITQGVNKVQNNTPVTVKNWVP
ncbi:MAG: efflux RND transporter periplasmic adaptor subunit [Verrucomicrobia bacterium]|nr:efflux RND transporter periplasmic adaptor subunit [Verrucomicrobiota bacterium]MDE3047130.1 efflux RND transporter periplasmic adaptor subunit [Verrucomicrobiota bacterium]